MAMGRLNSDIPEDTHVLTLGTGQCYLTWKQTNTTELCRCDEDGETILHRPGGHKMSSHTSL